MSGSGGFFKYRCKYFLSHNCNNWTYVGGSACSSCVAEGRFTDETWNTDTTSSSNTNTKSESPTSGNSSDVLVPKAENGTLTYVKKSD
ncbi:hypothetical protein VTJ49DRAFT_3084 [Mycothermus thermophilus]|uniref:Uncharacterized protein n=1 Tax=Humicola insolens TaxID=85995 RepID=A0ABR3V8B5_HUMIN